MPMKTVMYQISLFMLLTLLMVSCGSSSNSNKSPNNDGSTGSSGSGNQDANSTACSVTYTKAFAVATVSQPARAILSVIGFSEGTGNCYNYMFGYVPFTSYADHPDICQPFGSSCSTAAGRYQILFTTWTNIKKSNNYSDFSPTNQDGSALYLANRRGFTTYDNILTYTQFSAAIEQDLSYEWSSMPPGRYGQGYKSIDQLWAQYQTYVGQ